MEEIVKTQQVESTRGKVRMSDPAANARDAAKPAPVEKPGREEALRSTGDARKVVGKPVGRQTAQPSLGDPENAPGRPLRQLG